MIQARDCGCWAAAPASATLPLVAAPSALLCRLSNSSPSARCFLGSLQARGRSLFAWACHLDGVKAAAAARPSPFKGTSVIMNMSRCFAYTVLKQRAQNMCWRAPPPQRG